MTVERDREEALRRLARHLRPGGTLRRHWQLEGGVSAVVTALEIETGEGAIEILVLKYYRGGEHAENAAVLRREYRTLEALSVAGLPVPPPVAVDPVQGRWLAMHYVEGSTDAFVENIEARLAALAATLARFHATALETIDHGLLQDRKAQDTLLVANPPPMLHRQLPEAAIREALKRVWPPARRNADGFLHGDFWPGNVLWQDGRIVAVLDWEDACRGDPVADVSVSRLELLWAYGAEAMEMFTAYYADFSGADMTDLAIWDLLAALRPIHVISGWGLSDQDLRHLQTGHRTFTEWAIERLHGRR